MVDLAPATIRTWETRYGLVAPVRSEGGQRLYSRIQVDQLRFLKAEVEQGRRPGEAHRLLSERLAAGNGFSGTRMRVLLAGSGLDAARVLKELLGDGVDVASSGVVVVDPGDSDLDLLAARLQQAGAKVTLYEPK